jgi:short-subunit dehydrogenase
MGQTIVISGLAEGMGREVAALLAEGGDAVAGFDVNAEGLESLGRELSGLGADPLLEPLDITDRRGLLAFRDKVLSKYGAVDTVLSNVGVGFFGPFEEIDLERALKCLEINVIGAAALFQAFIPGMRERGAGKLVAMSSLVGQIPFPFESVYSASKFAVEGLILSFRIELRPFGIRVAIIEPAQVSTRFAAKIHKLPPEGSPYRERARRFIERDHALIKTAPTPREAAEKIVKVLRSARPKLYTQIELKSTVFIRLSRVAPTWVREKVLENYMDIRVKSAGT